MDPPFNRTVLGPNMNRHSVKVYMVILVVFTCVTSSTCDYCDLGYSFFHDGLTETCVKAALSLADWSKSRDYCNQEGAELLTIRTPQLNTFIQNYLKDEKFHRQEFWIGLNDLDSNGTFVWFDGSNTTNFNNWLQGEPKHEHEFNFTSPEQCVTLSGLDSRKWVVVYCDSKLNFICQKRAIMSPICVHDKSYSLYPDSINPTCVKAALSLADWHKSRDFCKQEGAELLTIRTPQMDIFIQNYLKDEKFHRQEFWIGLNDLDSNGTFVWLDENTPTKFNNWMVGETNSGNASDVNDPGDCVALSGTDARTWTRRQCGMTYNFICEKPYNNVATTTSITTTNNTTTNNTNTNSTSTIGTDSSMSLRYIIVISVGCGVVVLAVVGITVALCASRRGRFTLLRSHPSDSSGILKDEWSLASVADDDSMEFR